MTDKKTIPRPIQHAVVDDSQIPPDDNPAPGYYTNTLVDVEALPAGKSLRFEFADSRAASYFRCNLIRAAKKKGIELGVEKREQGKMLYVRIRKDAIPAFLAGAKEAAIQQAKMQEPTRYIPFARAVLRPLDDRPGQF